MGNCLDPEKPAATWRDEEAAWESQRPSRQYEKRQRKISFLRSDGRRSTTTQIKIKMSKKQLEELLRQVDGEGLPLQQMLADLAKDHREQAADQAGHWRPELQSIPELAE